MTTRIALASLFIVAAALAYPWESDRDYWILGIAAAVTVLVFAWWRGLFLTTRIARWLAILRRNRRTPAPRTDEAVTVVLAVADPDGHGLSLPVVAGYVNWFGLRCRTVRVTSLDRGGERRTWISLTLDPRQNLAALQARSAALPVAETAEVTARRLAEHLRETGLEVALADDAPAVLAGRGREKWSSVCDDAGAVSVYQVPVDDALVDRLAEIAAQPVPTWTAIEFRGEIDRLDTVVVAAFRTDEPRRTPPVAGLIAHRGIQRPLLQNLDPRSPAGLALPATVRSVGWLADIGWPVGAGAVSRT
ncbi:MAG: type VII secretion protein EccE [Mycolicibacterium hassiacum]|uniref:type VII secretion protein EccE n=1 Tax=Mycolicibacterium hassiacum TaxID=46351 RepID=UPI0023F6D4E2|nr:type VII secretion protein EccE [Mycolicibacterium hassiacum]MBX5487558.1 type VII secretion protein EccE [Mycolicibacterium hassiacum]